MSDMMLPILGAVTIGLLVWGLAQILTGVKNEKQRIAQRLSGEGKADNLDLTAFTVMRKKTEIAGLSGVFAAIPGFSGIAQRLAEIWPRTSLAKFVFISMGIALTVSTLVATLSLSLFAGGVAGLIAALLPLMVLNSKRAKRQKIMMDQLPEALDFLSRILRSGHSLSTGLQMMGQELPEPLASEFRRCYDQHSLGQSFEDALKDTANRVDSSDFGFFVTAVLIQRQTGGDLSEVLDNISGMIRGRIRLAQSVKAKTAEGRFTGYILVAFPVIMFMISYFLNPAYAGVLLHTSTGLIMLGVAGGLCILGLVAIRKITQIKV